MICRIIQLPPKAQLIAVGVFGNKLTVAPVPITRLGVWLQSKPDLPVVFGIDVIDTNVDIHTPPLIARQTIAVKFLLIAHVDDHHLKITQLHFAIAIS